MTKGVRLLAHSPYQKQGNKPLTITQPYHCRAREEYKMTKIPNFIVPMAATGLYMSQSS